MMQQLCNKRISIIIPLLLSTANIHVQSVFCENIPTQPYGNHRVIAIISNKNEIILLLFSYYYVIFIIQWNTMLLLWKHVCSLFQKNKNSSLMQWVEYIFMCALYRSHSLDWRKFSRHNVVKLISPPSII